LFERSIRITQVASYELLRTAKEIPIILPLLELWYLRLYVD